MNKPIYEYAWFKHYSDSQIGIRVYGRTFYPTKSPCRSCKHCGLLSMSYSCGKARYYCLVGVDLRTSGSEYPKPTERCFPMKERYTTVSADNYYTEALYGEIITKCNHEDQMEKKGLKADAVRVSVVYGLGCKADITRREGCEKTLKFHY